jgi:outer membrane protein assembly factor BamA
LTNVSRTWWLWLLLGLLSWSGAARAQDEEPTVPTTQPAPAVRVVGIDVHGSIDPPGRVEAYVSSIAPANSYYVEAGEIDRIAAPVSTVGRLRRALQRIGYDAVVEAVPAGPTAVRLRVHLRALDRVRHVFVKGNGLRVREEHVLRRLTLRPGQALPLPGPARDELLEGERKRVEDYLRGRGFHDAQVNIETRATNEVPARINLRVHIRRGEAYELGQVKVKGNTALPSSEIADAFRHHLLFWEKPFEQSEFRKDLTDLTERYRKLGYPGVRIIHDFDPLKSIDRANQKVRLSLEIRERKRIEVAFEGNKRRSDDALEEVLTLFSRGSYDDHEVESSAQAIAQHYRDRGHLLVKVIWRRERLGDQADRIVFTVNEGPELRVREVSFLGHRLIDADTLKEWVTVRRFPPLGGIGIGEGGYATIRQLQTDVERLVDRYAEEGFPDARVRCEISPGPGRFRPLGAIGPEDEPTWRTARSLHVRFLIEEGVRVRVASIRFERPVDGDPLPRSDD